MQPSYQGSVRVHHDMRDEADRTHLACGSPYHRPVTRSSGRRRGAHRASNEAPSCWNEPAVPPTKSPATALSRAASSAGWLAILGFGAGLLGMLTDQPGVLEVGLAAGLTAGLTRHLLDWFTRRAEGRPTQERVSGEL